MKRAIAVLGAAALMSAFSPISRQPAAAAIGPVQVLSCRSSNPQCWPTAFAFTPEGRIFYVERFSGQIRVYNPGNGLDRLWKRIGGIATDGEQGMLGIALDPRWPDFKWVYVYYTSQSPLQNNIHRLRGSSERQALLSIPASSRHNGGVIHMGPDEMLYVVTGDAGNPSRSQDLGDRAGKVLRIRKNGASPSNNPFRNRVWSYGHRNSFGFTFDPMTGRLWQSENGPECNDEVNRIRRGRNFGWGPNSFCPDTNNSGPNPVGPSWTYNPAVAPTGAAFCNGCRLGAAYEGTLLIGAWNDGRIRRLTLTPDRLGVSSSLRIYRHTSGILAVEAGPLGVYFSDSRGIYRLVNS
jgi:glucose/arabinose dehydrogenase